MLFNTFPTQTKPQAQKFRNEGWYLFSKVELLMPTAPRGQNVFRAGQPASQVSHGVELDPNIDPQLQEPLKEAGEPDEGEDMDEGQQDMDDDDDRPLSGWVSPCCHICCAF